MISAAESARAAKAEQRRQHILDTARALFIAQGFHQTGVAQIAAQSGVKVGQLYRDFAKKEEIIAAICERDLISWLDEEALGRALETNDHHALRQWLRRFGSSVPPLDQGRLMAEITAEAGRNPHIGAIMRGIQNRVDRNMSAALDALSPTLRQRHRREEIKTVIMAIRLGIMVRMVVNPDEDATELFRHAESLIDEALGDGRSGEGPSS